MPPRCQMSLRIRRITGVPQLSLEAMEIVTDENLEQGSTNADPMSSDNKKSGSRQASSGEARRAGETRVSPTSEELDRDGW